MNHTLQMVLLGGGGAYCLFTFTFVVYWFMVLRGFRPSGVAVLDLIPFAIIKGIFQSIFKKEEINEEGK